MDCELGEHFDITMRCTVWVTCCMALLVKKCNDGGSRRWDDFCLDVSKQIVGFLFASCLFSNTLGHEGSSVTDCEALWIRMVLTGTFCVGVEFLALNGFIAFADTLTGDVGDFGTGVYRDADENFQLAKYGKQLGMWLGCVLVASASQALLLWEFAPDLSALSHYLLTPVAWSSGLELAFVSVFTPCGMGFLQVWITDDFLRVGGCPLSEVAGTVTDHLFPSPPLPGSWAPQQPLHRPLLGDAGVTTKRTSLTPPLHLSKLDSAGDDDLNGVPTFRAMQDAPVFGGYEPAKLHAALPPPPYASVMAPDANCKVEALPNSPSSAANVVTSPLRSRVLWNVQSEVPKEPERPATKHSDLQQALAGMDQQVARAIACQPLASVVNEGVPQVSSYKWLSDGVVADCWRPGSDPLALPSSPSQGREVREAMGTPDLYCIHTPPGDKPRHRSELDELQARINEKDVLLKRLRDEVARSSPAALQQEVRSSPAASQPEPLISPARPAEALQPPLPPPSRTVAEPPRFAFEPPPSQAQTTTPHRAAPQPSQPSASSGAAPPWPDRLGRQLDRPLLSHVVFERSPQGSPPGRAPQEGDNFLDGKIAALQAKMSRLKPSGASLRSLTPRGGLWR